ncbi:sulfotransferase family protein [Streptomyces ureilyticus]|uniref:Sulfotransferase n=1 Tax=Streptomyces ureilyticus TaxID=1775131 RepID=A0ABX0DHC6_9ACTN|nr:sulfotransferase [Streptomyces ureilyticus]NGO41275.1 sulfotransferase [Streptomyces ureilyticus]
MIGDSGESDEYVKPAFDSVKSAFDSAKPVFIVSAGRCGSNLVSRLLGAHPDVTSVTALFARRGAGRLLHQLRSGPGFWMELTRPAPMFDAIVRDGMAPEEFAYPYGHGRFHPEQGVPLICHMTLPSLSRGPAPSLEPDGWYAELAADIPGWEARASAEQYLRLLEWFRRRTGGRVVVESTPGSLKYLDMLVRAYPDARFIYLHRDPVDTVLSMNRHILTRVDGIVRDALRLLRITSFADLSPACRPRMPLVRHHLKVVLPPYDIRAANDFGIPLDVFAQPWLGATQRARTVLAELPPRQRAVMRYEDLVTDPPKVLRALAEFLGVPAPADWLSFADRTVRRRRAGTGPYGLGDPLATLRAACAIEMPEPTLDRC